MESLSDPCKDRPIT